MRAIVPLSLEKASRVAAALCTVQVGTIIWPTRGGGSGHHGHTDLVASGVSERRRTTRGARGQIRREQMGRSGHKKRASVDHHGLNYWGLKRGRGRALKRRSCCCGARRYASRLALLETGLETVSPSPRPMLGGNARRCSSRGGGEADWAPPDGRRWPSSRGPCASPCASCLTGSARRAARGRACTGHRPCIPASRARICTGCTSRHREWSRQDSATSHWPRRVGTG